MMLQCSSIRHFGNASALQAGKGSVPAEERPEEEVPKAREHNNGVIEDETSQEKKDDIEKGSGHDGDFTQALRGAVICCCCRWDCD
ncbi:E3 ubiquitin-protein ligase [Sesbania bispinosa]|nr:E3 ubiquitin-protein ligase [Sesbania bispinosa]